MTAAEPALADYDRALAAATGLVTARLAGIPATLGGISPDADAELVVHLLSVITAAALETATDDRGAQLLQALGLFAQDGQL